MLTNAFETSPMSKETGRNQRKTRNVNINEKTVVQSKLIFTFIDFISNRQQFGLFAETSKFAHEIFQKGMRLQSGSFPFFIPRGVFLHKNYG